MSGMQRNWRGRFIKKLKETPADSREWLIWSRYHGAWHRRSEEGGACGYTSDIAHAGVFVRAKANAYNDGDRNDAFHVSEKRPQLEAALALHQTAMSNLRFALVAAGFAQDAKRLDPEGAAERPREDGVTPKSPLSPSNPSTQQGESE